MGDFWSSRIFSSSNLVSGICFSQQCNIFFSITFVLHAIFFFRQALAGIFFSKSPSHPPQELNGRRLNSFLRLVDWLISLKFNESVFS